jgi:excisionase family DNA binding protein
MAIQEELDLWGADARPALITIKQAAQLLNLGRSTVYELIAAGQLEVVHIGRSARIPTDAITALINRLRADQTVPARS